MKLIFRALLGSLLLAFSPIAKAQTWRPYVQPNSAEILHRLQKLNVLGSCLYIAAHPDDENTRLLAWLANEKKLRTGYLSLTRGDGGQNLIGPEQGEALGLIRTQELLAARRIDGAEQFFTRAYDFGYSKTPEETFRIWNRDSVLADVVWVIRQFRPDVIITRFPTTGEGGHGHHTASAILAVEAFDAAADPKRFPEQLKYVSVWQPRRLFWNTFNFGAGMNTIGANQLQIDVGGYNPLLGKSYGEIATEARSMHKSQGFGSARQRGSSIEYFKHLKGDSAKSDLFEGIDMSWRRMKGTESMYGGIAGIARGFDPSSPQQSIPALLQIQANLRKAVQEDRTLGYQLDHKLAEVDELLLATSGIYLEASSPFPSVAVGNNVPVRIESINRGTQPVRLLNRIIPFDKSTGTASTTKLERAMEQNRSTTDTVEMHVPGKRGFSDPYWLKHPRSQGSFSISDVVMIGRPEASPGSVAFAVEFDKNYVSVRRPIVHKTSDPAKGELYRPFEILPPVTANFSDKAYVFEGAGSKTINILIQSHADSARGTLELAAPTGWKVSIAQPEFSLKGRGAETTIAASVMPTGTASEGTLKASIIVGGERYTHSIRRIEYDHIPAQFYLPSAEARLVAVALKTAGKNIGYIIGAGDDVPAALRGVGYAVTELDEAAIMSTDLSKYSAIVTGVRAYNTQEWLQGAHEKLATYVREGGNLVVQYNTNNRIGPVKARIAPDSFTITRDRITDENATVNFLAPQHPALNVPNKISAQDFEGWIQERSIYHASNWAPSYTPILSMADPGEKANSGALIIAPHGKGNVVYTGLAFFRELPAGVPGAYKLFANLLALPNNN